MVRFLTYCLFAAVFSSAAFAQDPNPLDLEKLTQEQRAVKEKAEKLAKESAKVESEILKFKEDLRRTAAESESYEKAGLDINSRLTVLTRDEQRLAARLKDDARRQSELVAAFQRLSATPQPAIISTAKSASEAARAAIIMRDITAQLRARSDTFSAQLSELSSMRSGISAERDKLAQNEAQLSKKRGEIRELVKSKTARANTLSEGQKAAQKRASELAAKADSLRELIARFERAADDVVPRIKPAPGSSGPRIKPKNGARPPAPLTLPEGTRFADARGGLKPPVQGRLKSSYGGGRKGLTVAAMASAQVTAPFTGRIEFAGAFKNYDNVVILNVGDNYFMLLTGLGEIFVSSGEMVSAGEPVGLMPPGGSGEELYIELRKNGKPVNPKPWLGNAYAARG